MKTQTYPSIKIDNSADRLPVEVTLINQLGIGAGSQIIASSMAKQAQHTGFIDELDEPSTKIGDIHFKQDDQSSLYTFAVEKQGHPFHRHQGNRIFTAISGSSGTLLRFSTVSDAELQADEDNFIKYLNHIIVPPDCIFTVRFGGDTWHQFLPARLNTDSFARTSKQLHPALFAISCHTDELGGISDTTLKEQIMANNASIPMLTEVLPDTLIEKLKTVKSEDFTTTHLALRASPHSMLSALCAFTRYYVGMMRVQVTKLGIDSRGYVA